MSGFSTVSTSHRDRNLNVRVQIRIHLGDFPSVDVCLSLLIVVASTC